MTFHSGLCLNLFSRQPFKLRPLKSWIQPSSFSVGGSGFASAGGDDGCIVAQPSNSTATIVVIRMDFIC